jgi:8-oxo-dGTP pyrophosphatase MutT (NUDIX family)
VSASRLLEVAEIDLRLEARPWPFAQNESERIAAHWRKRQAERPHLFNGRVLLLGRHALETRADGASALRGAFFEVDFSAFLAWRDFGFPDRSTFNCFSAAALLSSDGAFLLGEMAAHTANAGSIYFPAGTPDLSDVFEGRVDLAASVARELEEETGLSPDAVAFGPSWTLVYDPPHVACIKVMRLDEPAEAAKARIEAFLAKDPVAELSRIHIIRRPEDLDAPRSRRFVADFLAFAFGR